MSRGMLISHAELMQICLFLQAKYMQFAGKNTRIVGENTRQTQAKHPHNRRQIYPQIH